jgi:2-polyprenyl-3-methyl-5-hydroxy-6-metoxy-1,4-benzoquinol methylase
MSDLVALQRTLYSSRNPTRRWLHTSRRDIVLDVLRTVPMPRTARALEVGPGSGVYLPALCSRFRNVVAIDVEPTHIAALRETCKDLANLELLIADICNQDWQRQFDIVLCSEVIEHVANPSEFMTGLANSVRPDGILILSTPQPWSLMELTAAVALSPLGIKLTRLIYREPVLPTGHISVQSSARITRLLRDNGFDILESHYFGLYVPVVAEFGGQIAVSVLGSLEKAVQRYGPRSMLWTQLHIARRRSSRLASSATPS